MMFHEFEHTDTVMAATNDPEHQLVIVRVVPLPPNSVGVTRLHQWRLYLVYYFSGDGFQYYEQMLHQEFKEKKKKRAWNLSVVEGERALRLDHYAQGSAMVALAEAQKKSVL